MVAATWASQTVTSPGLLVSGVRRSEHRRKEDDLFTVERSIHRDPNAVHSSDGVVVGRFVRDSNGRLWLEKTGLDPKKHQLRAPLGWATDRAHLETLRERAGYGVRIRTNDGTTYETTLDEFDRRGIPINRGHGWQVVLPLKFWQVYRPGARQLGLALEAAR